MSNRYIVLCVSAFCLSASALAQDSVATRLSYDLSAEAAIGSGDYTAFQLVANRHHTLATRPNTAFLRGAVNISHSLSQDLTLSGAVDGTASVHADHKAYLQQCYANLSYKSFFIEAGSREQRLVVRDNMLSVGSFVKGSNAKPIPQVHLGTSGFWSVPLTRQWVQVNFDFGYGKFLDSGYRDDMFQRAPDVNSFKTTGAYYHQKHLYIRTNPTKRFFAMVGIEHAVQFGGSKLSIENGVTTEVRKPASLKAFWEVILPVGDSNYSDNGAMEDWVYGNHIGVMTYQIGWNIDGSHQLQVYLDNPFEDGSGVRKGNGWDGTWGLQYTNNTSGRQYVRGAVFEYVQTTNQSGPLHWDPSDYPEPVRSQITDVVTGEDSYYNNNFYDSYAHYGMTPGNPLITSPIYNQDGFTGFRDNRVRAWHLGVSGELTSRLSYLVKGSYREGWGTYSAPLPAKRHSLDAMVQALYAAGPWQFAAAYAFDKGNIYGDCSTFNFKIGYHGKIL